MRLSHEDSNMVCEQQKLLSAPEHALVQNTMRAMFTFGTQERVRLAKDDCAAVVEATLIRYVIGSRDQGRPTMPAVLAARGYRVEFGGAEVDSELRNKYWWTLDASGVSLIVSDGEWDTAGEAIAAARADMLGGE